MHLLRTTSASPDFITLVRLLDADLAIRNGDEKEHYAHFNSQVVLQDVVVAYDGSKPVACGAIREFAPDAMEVKRMYTRPEYRGKGYAAAVLQELERWSAELGYKRCVLETGTMLPEAIAMYESRGYTRIPAYGDYIRMPRSVCFEKSIH